MLGINVEREEPTIVPPAEDTTKKGTLYFLSNLDYNFPCKVRSVYLFKPSKNIEGNVEGEVLVEVIKNALSKALVIYYPVAGRLTFDSEGRMAVDCTDEGAVFVEAEAGCTLEEIGDDTVSMGDLVYDVPAAKHIMDMPPLAVQVTKFSCGGFAMGICVNHLVFDGQTGMDFINSWGEIARGLSLKVPPFFDRSILKGRNPPKIEFDHQEFLEIEDIPHVYDLYNEAIIYKSFGFDTVKLEKLKATATEDGAVVRCSTFEALSGFIWKSRTQALKIPHDQKIKLLLVVDGRSKFDPPLPENYFGNGVVIVSCLTTAGKFKRTNGKTTIIRGGTSPGDDSIGYRLLHQVDNRLLGSNKSKAFLGRKPDHCFLVSTVFRYHRLRMGTTLSCRKSDLPGLYGIGDIHGSSEREEKHQCASGFSCFCHEGLSRTHPTNLVARDMIERLE
ncbi:hypothetical protein RHSIM_Rhsim09G0031400 [Rhododendron simsii]|uniref:Uncharacterized protein n=1 Tax=Rhododendron simsii TaxID=118357 RepID=A0A834GDR0_RHOSS|nr:hypothetical protein RHSIM_Rhsim09G0031400 [Rhododendron simsii]